MRFELGNSQELKVSASTSPTSLLPVIGRGLRGFPGPGSAAWAALTAITTGEIRQAPDGSWIRSTTARTTRATFDTTEAGFWTAVLATSGTVEQAAVSTSIAAAIAARLVSGTNAATKVSSAIVNLFASRVASPAFCVWRESIVQNLPTGVPATIDAFWIGRQIDADRWECQEIRNVTSANPTSTTGKVAYQLRARQIRQAGGLIETDGTSAITVTRTGTGWAAVTSGADFAHNANYYRTIVVGDAASVPFPGAAVRLRIRCPRLTNGGYATVSIDGSLTAATGLTTAQAEVTAGRMHAAELTSSALVTGSGGAITSGSADLSVTAMGTGFVAGDVGRKITVPNAGAAGANLTTWVKAVVDSTHVTLVNTASSTVSGKAVTFPAGTLATTTRVQSFYSATTDYQTTTDIVSGLTAQGPDRVVVFTHTGAMPLAAVSSQTEARTYLDVFSYMLSGASAATFAGTTDARQVIDAIFPRASSSVHESAVIPKAGQQFMGGSHGYDQTDSLAVVVDGVPVTLTDLGTGLLGSSIAILRKDTWYDQTVLTTQIAKWNCVYAVSAAGFPVEWDRTMLVSGSFTTQDVAMLPLAVTFTRSRNLALSTAASQNLNNGAHVSNGRCNAVLCWQPTGSSGGYAAILYVPDVDQSARGLPCSDAAFVEDRSDGSIKKVYFTRSDATTPEAYVNGDRAHGSMLYAVQHFDDPEALFGGL